MTRRDFLNGSLIGAGSSLLEAAPPAAPSNSAKWDGPGGLGDYASSHGNPWDVMEAAHRIRDGKYSAEHLPATDTREVFDLVVVGGGMSGLGAAFYFNRDRKPGQTCLILENHPIFGGESKRNEFVVGGQRLLAPQGANEFDIPTDPADDAYQLFESLKIPKQFQYQDWPGNLRPLEFDRTNYGFQHWIHAPSFGHLVNGRWVRDFWRSGHASADLKKWKYGPERHYQGADWRQWLDTMTYQHYLERVIGLSSEVTRYAHPILAAAVGLGCDALSAYAAFQVGLPGFQAFPDAPKFPVDFDQVPASEWHMFPGGNTGFARYLVKSLIPAAIGGTQELDQVINRRVRFQALDRQGAPVRVRLRATVVRVEQTNASAVITYEKGGRLFRLQARSVVLAGGSWASRHIVRDLPGDKREAFEHFFHSPVLVVNVAVRHWRFLYDLGLTAARWDGGFGFSCNVRREMVMPGFAPRLSPDSPTVITFYIPLYYPGVQAKQQGGVGRRQMLATPFAEYEAHIRDQVKKLFGQSAVDAIAGIILNRWGHAYVNPAPGFFFGTAGKPSPPDVIRKPLGRITFAHSELNGHQFWLGAIREGRRAVGQLRSVLGS